ncbi:hypothetical protein HOY80DRAFT_701055 [Tuber brumale]|nr:hypothetical protein HOY80DRAFT_701055 [Tuber brumale]
MFPILFSLLAYPAFVHTYLYIHTYIPPAGKRINSITGPVGRMLLWLWLLLHASSTSLRHFPPIINISYISATSISDGRAVGRKSDTVLWYVRFPGFSVRRWRCIRRITLRGSAAR